MKNSETTKSFDVIAVGELLIDLIGVNKADSLEDTFGFNRFAGGSPANFARNLSKLDNRVKLVASIGEDGLGRYLQSQVEDLELDCSGIEMRADFPTTIITVAKTEDTPDFQAYRGADAQILPQQLSPSILKQARVFHTTCFALSKKTCSNKHFGGSRNCSESGLSIEY